VDKKKMGAVAAIPAVLTFGALGFTQQQGTAQHTGSAAQAGQQAENSAADPDKTSSRTTKARRTIPDKPRSRKLRH
jgi:hypothetical protein